MVIYHLLHGFTVPLFESWCSEVCLEFILDGRIGPLVFKQSSVLIPLGRELCLKTHGTLWY